MDASRGTLDGQVALVTGASRGLGRAIALALADAGASLHLAADGSEEELAQVAGACVERCPSARVSRAILDLSRPDAPADMVDAAVREHGRIDILVNNAGVRIRKPFGQFTADDFDRLMAVNLRAPMLAAQAAAAHMRARGSGRIINVASQLGTVTDTHASLYGMSKAALLYLTRSMAVELARSGIVVNAVSPGTTATDFILATLTGAQRASRIDKIPAGRLGRPDEIAQAVVFLATTPATFLLGHNLIVDGGETAK
ncbi:MAG: glucose 1-dehydrogenase [Acidobacteria bacterium]|nr:glucose 1-dehydrogenase [Acidobacteriota bacterium]